MPVAMGGSAVEPCRPKHVSGQGSFGAGATNLNYSTTSWLTLDRKRRSQCLLPFTMGAGAAIGANTYVVGGRRPGQCAWQRQGTGENVEGADSFNNKA